MSNPYQRHLLDELSRRHHPAREDESMSAAVDRRIEQLLGELARRAEHEARARFDPSYVTRNVPN